MAKSEVKKLKRKIEALGPASQGRRVPDELRRQVATAARGLLAEGVPMARAAESFGVAGVTLRRWLESAPSRLVPVAVVAHQGRGVSLVSPTGWRIEGLEATEAVALLEKLA